MQALNTSPNLTQSTSSYDSVVSQALMGLYKEDRIFACAFERHNINDYSVSFVFPRFTKTVIEMDHISANQINEAILEAVYCAFYAGISEGAFEPHINHDWYYRVMYDWIIFSQTVTYRKMLVEGKASVMRVFGLKLGSRKLNKRFISLTGELDGYVSGEFEWLLPVKLAPH